MNAQFVMIDGIAFSPKHPRALALQRGKPPETRPPEPDAPKVQNGFGLQSTFGISKGLRVAKRIRQSSKPKMNKLEMEWFEYLKRLLGDSHIPIHAQDKTYVLANGLRYTPDFTAIIDRTEHAWEVKGKWVDGDSFPKLKMFASKWPEVHVILVWKDHDGQWQKQPILP